MNFPNRSAATWSIAMLSLLIVTPAIAGSGQGTRDRNILFSVGSELIEHRTEAWTQERCTALHATMASLLQTSIASACVGTGIDYASSRKINEARESKDFHFHVRYRELNSGEIKLEVENWKKDRDETDFQSAGWTIDTGTPEQKQQLVSKMLNHIAVYDRHERKIKEFFLVNGLSDDSSVQLGSNGEYYVDFRRASFEQAYGRFKSEGEKHKNFLRASLEIAAVLGLGSVQYYVLTGEENAVDWDYNSWRDYRRKIGSLKSWRFDTNQKGVNISHAFAGTLYYWAVRANGYSVLESFLFAFTGSTIWEYICEAREKVSINDQIVTPVGGFVIGEVLYQFGEFFNRGGNTLPNRILSSIFGGPQRFHAWLDKQKLPKAVAIDKYGFNADVWHKFDLSIGFAESQDSSKDDLSPGVAAGFDLQVVKLPTYDQEGKGEAFLKDTVMAQMTAELLYGKNGMEDVSALLKTVLAAYYKQDMYKDERGRMNGYSFMIGPSSSVDYRSSSDFGGVANEWHAAINVIGASVDVIAYKKDVRVQFKIDVYPNFTMVRSIAVEDYADRYGRAGIKTVMNDHENNNYYYALGLTAGSSLSVSYRGLELGGSANYGYYDSIDGLDRFQEKVTNDVHLKDKYLALKTWFSHPVFRKNIRMVYSVEHIERSGTMAQVSKTAQVNRYMGRLVFLF